MRGQKVSTQPRLLNRMYCGMITTWIGSMMVPSMTAKSMPRIGNRSRAKA